MLDTLVVHWEEQADSTCCMPWRCNRGKSGVAHSNANSIFKCKIASRRLDDARICCQTIPGDLWHIDRRIESLLQPERASIVIGVLMRDKNGFDVSAFEAKLLDSGDENLSRFVGIVQSIDQDQAICIDGPC